MFKTRVTELLGIDYPIIQGAMARVSCPELVAAVSNAGGLGILVSARFESGKELREEIRKTKRLTDKPFGVNLSFSPAVKPIPNDEFVDVVVDEGVSMVETSGHRSPDEFVEPLKKGNVKVIHKCAAVRHAQRAERIGVDAVAVVGFENGGAIGMDDVTTFILVPLTVDAVKIPVLAGGGIGNARGFVAALALGAEGVVVGTRFMASKESPVHSRFKEWMLQSSERDTVPVQRSIRNTHRALRSKTTERLLEMEARGASLEEILPIIGRESGQKVVLEGELEAGIGLSGQVVGLIREILSVKAIIDEMVSGATAFREQLKRIIA